MNYCMGGHFVRDGEMEPYKRLNMQRGLGANLSLTGSYIRDTTQVLFSVALIVLYLSW